MIPEPFVQAIADRYRVIREAGHGGMATVYLADDLKYGRKVAIKVMHQESAADLRTDRFLREIEIVARLTHPHILPLFDSGAAGGRLYYVMPFIEGETLRARLAREKQLSLEDSLRLTREIAGALNYAHQHGLIHRDVKPENVLLADGIALVADFGIARATASGAALSDMAETMAGTKAGAFLGTPRYMSPEQATGGEVDSRTDLYSLACTLYEMLAGVPPFPAATPEESVRMHLTATPRDIAELRPNVPPGVAMAIHRALAKLPSDRYPGMMQFAEALTVGASVGSTPTPTPEPRGRIQVENNLPRHRTQFIGRDRELAECARQLGDTRLLTITGVGGSGKTRLALRLAESMLDTFPDGVWLVDMAPIDDESLIESAVTTTVGAKIESGISPEEALVAHLANRRSLLLLDNCEHLLGPVSDLADRLLAALPELRLLVTSREGLGVEGERIFALRSLELPPADTQKAGDAVMQAESVRLFLARARDAAADFQVDRAGVEMVAEICRRLDGIPLAIELAAARTRALSVEQIAQLLDDRFRLLTGGSRSLLERHRTLRTTVQWSYDNLSEDERQLFTAVCVFSGSWTLSMAADLTGMDSFLVLDLLTHLIDKSMLQMERGDGTESRYRLLETLRQFGVEVLSTTGNLEDLRREHFRVILEHVRASEKMGPGFALDLNPTATLRHLGSQVDNLRAALTWGFANDEERAAELVLLLTALWFVSGFWEEGRQWYARALDCGSSVPPESRGKILMYAGRLAFAQGKYEGAAACYAQGIELYRELGAKRELALLLLRYGGAANYQQRYGESKAAFEEARVLIDELGDETLFGSLENNLGVDKYQQGDYPAARQHFDRTVAIGRSTGNEDQMQVGLGNLALVNLATGDLQAAREDLLECMSVNRDRGNLYGISHDLPAFAELFRLEGNHALAARTLGVVDAILEELGAGLEAMERDMYRRVHSALQETMGEQECERHREAGRSESWEDILAAAAPESS